MEDEKRGYLELVAYSLLAGVVGVFVRLLQGIDAQSIVFLRAAIAASFIFLAVAAQRKIRELKIVHPVKTLFVGLFQGASIFLYITALLNTTVSNALFLLYTAPIFSVILAKVFLKEDIEKETVIGVLITLAGIVLILDPRTFSFDSGQTFGNIVALGSGFFYAAMALTAKPIMKKTTGYYVAFWQYLVISLMFLPFMGAAPATVAGNWWLLAIIGIVCTGIPFVLFMEGIKKIKAQKIFIITALEPLAGTLLAMVVLHEMPPLLTVAGALLVMYGVFRVASRTTQAAKKEAMPDL